MHTKQIGKTNSFGLDQRTPVNLAKLEDFFSLQLVLVLNLVAGVLKCVASMAPRMNSSSLSSSTFHLVHRSVDCFESQGVYCIRGFQGTAYVQIHFSFSF